MSESKKGKSILVVDDDPDIRETLAEFLVWEGFTVRTAEDGAAAIDRIHEDEPALVLLDLMMPVLDGYGFLERRRKEASLSGVDVIVITAGSVDRQRLGDVEVLTKPLNLDRLLLAMHKHGARPLA